MAFSGMGGNAGTGGRRRGRFAGGGALSEMNVVPLVDVVLVLLIIFMITASAMEFGLDIKVPEVKQVQESTQDLPVLSITQGGDLYLGDKPVNINLLAQEVERRYPGSKDVYLVGDKNAVYGEIVGVVSVLSQAKLGIKLVAKQQDVKKP
jgi:biopolymer transport protein TolR